MGSEVQRRQVRFISSTDLLTRCFRQCCFRTNWNWKLNIWLMGRKKSLAHHQEVKKLGILGDSQNTPYVKQQRMKACRKHCWLFSGRCLLTAWCSRQAGSRSCCIALISEVEWIILKFRTNFSSLSQTPSWQILSSLAACCLAATVNYLVEHLVLIFLLWQLFGWQCTNSMRTRNVVFCLVFPIS